MNIQEMPGTPFRSLEVIYRYGIAQCGAYEYETDFTKFKTWYGKLYDILSDKMRSSYNPYANDGTMGYKPYIDNKNSKRLYVCKSDIWFLLLKEIMLMKTYMPDRDSYLHNVLVAVLEDKYTTREVWRHLLMGQIFTSDFYSYLDFLNSTLERDNNNSVSNQQWKEISIPKFIYNKNKPEDCATYTLKDIKPFADLDLESGKYNTSIFETYGSLDSLRRCGIAFANICEEIMPPDDAIRGDISSVTPSGWGYNNEYPETIPDKDNKYLYHRCHLIGWQLSGENANGKNLITGTQYLNNKGMLPIENEIANYIKANNAHVLYRVTPIFLKNNLVAHGVLLERYSVEDEGKTFNDVMYCYNVQPGIEIDYLTGQNSLKTSPTYGGAINFKIWVNQTPSNAQDMILQLALAEDISKNKYEYSQQDSRELVASINIDDVPYMQKYDLTTVCRNYLKLMETPCIQGNLLRYIFYDFYIFSISDPGVLQVIPDDPLSDIQRYVFRMGDYDRDSKNKYSKDYSAVKEDNDKEMSTLVDMLKNGDIEHIITYLTSNESRLLGYDLTPNNYYSGDDAYIFFNGERAGEVTYIDWRLEENTKPIYGYASYTWDEIAKGQRIVTGKLSMNFLKTNYMNALLQQAQKDESINHNELSIYDKMKNKTIEEKKKIIEDVLNNSNNLKILELAEKMDELLWAPDNAKRILDKYRHSYFNNINPSFDNSSTSNLQGFDIIIAWGNELFKMADMQSDGSETVTIINDVHLISESQKVEINAGNTQVIYEFVARDLNNTLVTEQDKIKLYGGV